MFKKRILTIFFLNIGFATLLSGCYSSMHQAQVTDGYSMALAFRPIHREFVYSHGFALPEWSANDIIASTAFRHLGGEKKPLSYLDKLVGCLGGLSLLMIFLIYTS